MNNSFSIDRDTKMAVSISPSKNPQPRLGEVKITVHMCTSSMTDQSGDYLLDVWSCHNVPANVDLHVE